MSTLVLKNKGTLKDYIKENSAITAGQERVFTTVSVLGSCFVALMMLAQIF